MIKIIYESDLKMPSYYEYNGYNIYYDKWDGKWKIPNFKAESFDEYEQAEDFIDNLPVLNTDIADEIETKEKEKKPSVKSDNGKENKPFPNSTTYKVLGNKYRHIHCPVYLLRLYDSDMYASRNGICEFCDDDMQIFKTKKDAHKSRLQRKGDYVIEYAEIENGEIYTL